MTRLNIVHLFPRELGINGDVGNISALVFRARAYGLDVTVHDVHRGEPLPRDVDLIHIGSGPFAELQLVLPDVQKLAPHLHDLRDAGVPFLAISAGWFGLSRLVTDVNGVQHEGAGVFTTEVSILPSRVVGEIALETKWGTVTGFENHSAKVDDGELEHFGSVTYGVGSDPALSGSARWEGVVRGTSIGTNLHGSLLPMNPGIADFLIEAAVQRTVSAWMRPPSPVLAGVDEFARHSREAIIKRLH